MRALVRCLGIGIFVTAACGGSSSTSTSTGSSTSTSTGSSTISTSRSTSSSTGSSNNGPTNSNGRNSLTGQCSGSTSSQLCAGEDAYVQCLETACDSEFKAALGNGYASGSPSGPCGSYIACELVCPCDATASACEDACYATDVTNNASCYTAFQALSTCALTSACKTPVCATNTTGTVTSTATLVNTATLTNTATFTNSATLPGTTTLTNTKTLTDTSSNTNTATTNCALLLSCCDTLLAGAQGAAYQQTCTQLATYGDAVCLQVLTEWQQSGICK
jgi:hypothetical protein